MQLPQTSVCHISIHLSDKESDFVEKLTCDETVEKLDTVERKTLNCSNVNTDFINDIVLEFTNVISDVASDMFSRKISHNIDSLMDNRINMSWYSEECKDRRHDVLHLLNEYRQNRKQNGTIQKTI